MKASCNKSSQEEVTVTPDVTPVVSKDEERELRRAHLGNAGVSKTREMEHATLDSSKDQERQQRRAYLANTGVSKTKEQEQERRRHTLGIGNATSDAADDNVKSSPDTTNESLSAALSEQPRPIASQGLAETLTADAKVLDTMMSLPTPRPRVPPQPGAYACTSRPTGVRPRPGLQEASSGVNATSSSTFLGITSLDSIATLNSQLTQANPIEEVNLPLALPQEPGSNSDKPRWCQRHCLCAALGCVGAIALIVLVTVIVVVFSNQPNPGVISHGTSNPETAAQDQLLSLLPRNTTKTIEQNPDSPQHLAFQWLYNDPHMEQYTESRLVQRFALTTLFYALGGNDWINSESWLSYSVPECQWFTQDEFGSRATTQDGTERGYSMGPDEGKCNMDGMYLHLWLHTNKLRGTLPEELFLLTNLRSLDLSRNQKVTGTLSTELGQLTDLEMLANSVNSMSGSLPSQIGQLTALQGLLMFYNKFTTGIIPTEIGHLKELRYLVASRLQGTLPTELGLLENVVWMDLFSDNKSPENCLSGTLPTELGLLTHLVELNIHDNVLSGTMPSQLGLLTKLAALKLEENLQLTGTIPTQIGELESLQSLRLKENSLEGSIPEGLGPFLKELRLNDNPLLSGTLPVLLSVEERLDIAGTAISGVLPHAACNASKLDFDCNPSVLCGCDCECDS